MYHNNSYGGAMGGQYGGYGGDGVLGSAPGYNQAAPYPVQAQQLQAQQLQAQQLQQQQQYQQHQQQQQQQQQYQQQIREMIAQQQQSSSSQSQLPWEKSSSSSAVNHEPEPDPDMYETSVYLGIDDDNYDYRTKVVGEKGENLDYVRKSTGAKVLLRGKGSGVYNTRPPHIFISHSTLSGMEDAEKLAYNLIKSVKEDYQEWKSKVGVKSSSSRSQNTSGSQRSSGSREVHHYNHGDRGQQHGQAVVKDYGHSSSGGNSNHQSQYDDGARYSGGYMQDSSPRQRQSYDNGSARNNVQQHQQQQLLQQQQQQQQQQQLQQQQQQQQQQQGGHGDVDRYGRSSQVDNRNALFCDICNIRCPNREMYERHIAGQMHLETIRHNQKKQQRDLGGTHWEGPPEPAAVNPHQRQWQDLDTGMTLEDYIFTQCEKVLKSMISDVSLRNLKRSVEKIGQRDLKSALPSQPQSNTYCKLCKETVPNMQQHLTVKSHGNMYLLRQIQLGEIFMEYYSDVPIPGVITNGGRVLAMDTLAFGPYIPETNRERFKQLLVYSGAYLAYKCSVCTTNITCLSNWVQHTTSKRHGRVVIENILVNGLEAFIAKNPHIPVPPPRNALEILSGIENISNVHPTIPHRRSTRILPSGGGGRGGSDGQVSVSMKSPSRGRTLSGGQYSAANSTSTGYQQLASLLPQERQLVLQVQALTGIDDLTLVINVLTALGRMDPDMLQTLSALDPVAIQHAVSGNVALQGMDVKFVQKVIKMYMNYKGIPMPAVQQPSQSSYRQQQQQQQQQQVVPLAQLQMYQQQRMNQANWVSGASIMRGGQRGDQQQGDDRRAGSRWDTPRGDRGSRGGAKGKSDGRSQDRDRGGRSDNKGRNDRGKGDNKDKKPDNKSKSDNKGKTNKKTESKTDNKKDNGKGKTDKKYDPKGKTDKKDDPKGKTDKKDDPKAKTDKKDDGKGKPDSKKDNKPDSKATDKTKTDAGKETSGKRPGDKVTEPPAKKAAKDSGDDAKLVDLTKEDAAEKKTEEKKTEEKDTTEAKEEKKEEGEEKMETETKEAAKDETPKTEAKEEAEEEIVEIKDDTDEDVKKTTKEQKEEEKPKVEETTEPKEAASTADEYDDIKEVEIPEKEAVGKPSPRGRGRARRSRGKRGAAAGGRKTRASLRGQKEEADEVDKSTLEEEEAEKDADKSGNESLSLENFQTVDEYIADDEPETKKVCKEGDTEKSDETAVEAAGDEAGEEGIDVDMDDGTEGDDGTEEIDEDKLLEDE